MDKTLMNHDIFIVSCQKHFHWLHWCLKSIDRYVTGFRRVILIIEAQDHFSVSQYNTDIRVIKLIPPPDAPGYQIGIGYHWQCGVKMEWTKYTDADAALILDSDHVITSPIHPGHFYHKGKPIQSYVSWDKAEIGDGICWKPSADFFVGADSPFAGMCQPGMLFTREATDGYSRFMMARHKSTPVEYFCHADNLHRSEFETFCSYLAVINDHGYAFLHRDRELGGKPWPIHQGWTHNTQIDPGTIAVLKEAGLC